MRSKRLRVTSRPTRPRKPGLTETGFLNRSARPAAARLLRSSRAAKNRPTRSPRLKPGLCETGFPAAADREGSTLVVVVALLGALFFLGIFFYSFAAREETTAENWNEAAKRYRFDPPFDFALQQIILGPDNSRKQSVLWGGDKSLLATMYGRDAHPYAGAGINAVLDASGVPDVDQDYDGTPDPDPVLRTLLDINRSPAAVGGTGYDFTLAPPLVFPDPDVPYTYPDVTSPFLSYFAVDPVSDRRVIIPSFHRPQILRNVTGDEDWNQSTPAAGVVRPWYSDPQTRARVLRPHVEHEAIASNGQPAGVARFISATHPYTPPPGRSPVGSFPFPGSAESPNWAEGVWTNQTSSPGVYQYQFDADPDGDGVNEAIWLDLGHPVQERFDGRLFVPMFAITIKDLDALLNLNAHGNIAGVPGNADVRFRGAGFGLTGSGWQLISQSNQGLGPWEVNPAWGLSADPTSVPSVEYSQKFGDHMALFDRPALPPPLTPINPTGGRPDNVIDLSNMEWWFLTAGRRTADGSELRAGRWGEIGSLSRAYGLFISDAFPKAGQTGRDDNRNAIEGGYFGMGGSGGLYPVAVEYPRFGRPLDIWGSGDFVANNGTDRQLATWGPFRWPQYTGYRVNAAQPVGMTQRIHNGWLAASLGLDSTPLAGTPLMPNFSPAGAPTPSEPKPWAPWTDDPAEMVLDPDKAVAGDARFGPEEIAVLQLTDLDLERNDLTGRVGQLASFNFQDAPNAETIRGRFTTTSWDTLTYSRPFYAQTGNQFRSWEFTFDNTENANVFPPSYTNTAGLTGVDPLRQELRHLMGIAHDGQNRRGPQRRLSVNGVLDFEDLNNNQRYDWDTDRLRFRPLTPHPDGLDDVAVPVIPTNPPRLVATLNSGATRRYDLHADEIGVNRPTGYSDPTQAVLAQQEWLARRDRQLMCRDIYVLLYLFGGANDARDYLITPNNADLGNPGDVPPGGLYSAAQLEEMAQFAVNLVDALDPDDVMTAFEYDLDLSDGWNLDDNAFTTPDDETPSGEPDEYVRVFGVEEQSLTLNEALVVFAPKDGTAPTDTKATQWDDQNNNDFLYVELQNVSPRTVNFNGDWQIAVIPKDGTDQVTRGGDSERRVILQDGIPSVGTGDDSYYVIGTAGVAENKDTTDGRDPDNSRFRVDPNGGTALETIIPRSTVPNPELDLDLLENDGENQSDWYTIYKAPPASDEHADFIDGDQVTRADLQTPDGPDDPIAVALLQLLDPTAAADPMANTTDATKVEFELRRRLNTLRTAPQDPANGARARDNPWIVVDRIAVPLRRFELGMSPSAQRIQDELKKLISLERREPLDGIRDTDSDGVNDPDDSDYASNHRYHTLGLQNSEATTPYRLWQPHTNRDFASAIELFNLPLYGPSDLTARLGAGSPVDLNANAVAGPVFLQRTANPLWANNRWYRLLSLVETPSRLRWQDSDESPWYVTDVGRLGNDDDDLPHSGARTPGQINLNTLRHPHVLGGLLDDTRIANITLASGRPELKDPSGSGRDWWEDVAKTRDGEDPLLNADIYLPGVPGTSRPFRGLGHFLPVSGQPGIEHTLLRENPTAPSKSLFELGDGDFTTMQHRLLSKIVNNTTTRSNAFAVFIQIELFEAVEVPAGQDADGNDLTAIRIGARLDNTSSYRGFFVLDRSEAVERLIPAHLPKTEVRLDGNGQVVETYDTFSFNRGEDVNGNRQLDGGEDTNGNGRRDRFNWQSLVLYRRLLE